MLGRDVNFKVVAPRPRLIALFTFFHCANVDFPTGFGMNRTFVSLQIVRAAKTIGPFTATVVTDVLITLLSGFC